MAPVFPATVEFEVVLRLTGRKEAVRPGEIAAIPSSAVNIDPPAYFISIEPSGRSVVWNVARRGESKTRTLHHVTVKPSAADRRKILPPVEGSRSAKKGATRPGPASSLLTLRAELS